MGDLDFSHEDVERARALSPAALPRGRGAAAPRRRASIRSSRGAGSATGSGAWSTGSAGPGAAAAWAALVLVVAALVRLPLDVWRGLVFERRWGFSKQTAAAWAADQAKGLAITVALGAGVWVAARRARPRAARLVGAARGGGARAAHALPRLRRAGRARAALQPLRAARRPASSQPSSGSLPTTPACRSATCSSPTRASARRRSNAYVSGLGATRRVVLWDTLLQSTGEREVKLVIAHELGHRRERHAAKFTLLFIAGGCRRRRRPLGRARRRCRRATSRSRCCSSPGSRCSGRRS